MSTHIGAQPGDIAPGILLPGDPLRAKYIAENFLTGAVCFNNVRGMLGFTGEYNGQRLSVMGTGMGIPSISIYITELMREYDVKHLIRVGTCGSIRPEIAVGDVVLAQGACTDSDMNRHIFSGLYCPVADFSLLRAASLKAGELGIRARVGNVLSQDLFYAEETVPGFDIWAKYGVMALEMETAALFTLAKKFGRRAASILTVSDSLVSEGQNMTAAEREQSTKDMMRLGLETLAAAQEGRYSA